MNDIKIYYKALKVNSRSPFWMVKRNYRVLALKYHPRSKTSNYYFSIFIRIVSAYDLLSKINECKKNKDPRSVQEIFEDWMENEKYISEDKAKDYINLKRVDFERNFLRGFGLFKRALFTFFLLLFTYTMFYPINEYYEGRISGYPVIVISLLSLTMVYFILKALQKEIKGRKRLNKIEERSKKDKMDIDFKSPAEEADKSIKQLES